MSTATTARSPRPADVGQPVRVQADVVVRFAGPPEQAGPLAEDLRSRGFRVDWLVVGDQWMELVATVQRTAVVGLEHAARSIPWAVGGTLVGLAVEA